MSIRQFKVKQNNPVARGTTTRGGFFSINFITLLKRKPHKHFPKASSGEKPSY